MRTLTVKDRRSCYDDANAEAAQIILSDPARYEGALLEWAQMIACRMVRTEACRYLPLAKLWARTAYQRAFDFETPGRELPPEGDREESSELRAWQRR